MDQSGSSRRICEAALLYIIGYIDSPNASDANPQWQTYKRLFSGDLTAATNRELSASAKEIKKSTKQMNVKSFIQHLVNIYFGETIASHVGANDDGTAKDIKVLPYENLSQLYEVNDSSNMQLF